MMKKIFQRIIILLCVTALLIPAGLAAENRDSGDIRVLLTKVTATDRMEIALDGSYSLNGIVFQRGCHLTVSCRTGSILCYYEGMALDTGNTMILTRHACEDPRAENGLRINGSYYLYPGSLKLTIENGMLRAVLTIGIEEYLNGVVPYEIGEGSGIEALKAQAIAARTYALSRTGSSRDFDVYDNTNDQVYYGTKPENVKTAAAVQATAGMVGWYGGAYANCYYSASNGGQTESSAHVWGGDPVPYLPVKNDPYDPENKTATVMTAVIKKDTETEALPAALENMLLDALAPTLKTAGYDDGKENIRIRRIEDITLTGPLYPGSGSLLYREMTFTLRVSGRRPNVMDDEEEIYLVAPAVTPTPRPVMSSETLGGFTEVPGSIKVTLPLYGGVEKALDLSINAANNEVFTIITEEDAFRIESRRFGHGVGMSQCGAQVMAAEYGMTYEQILNFYYPGMQIKTISLTGAAATPVKADFLITPGPAATPTPRPTPVPLTLKPQKGEYIVVVDQIAVNSSLNMRDAPGMGGTILRVLYYGQELIVKQELGDWLQVYTNEFEGYVMRSFVTKKP